jgi:hypothetical protein
MQDAMQPWLTDSLPSGIFANDYPEEEDFVSLTRHVFATDKQKKVKERRLAENKIEGLRFTRPGAEVKPTREALGDSPERNVPSKPLSWSQDTPGAASPSSTNISKKEHAHSLLKTQVEKITGGLSGGKTAVHRDKHPIGESQPLLPEPRESQGETATGDDWKRHGHIYPDEDAVIENEVRRVLGQESLRAQAAAVLREAREAQPADHESSLSFRVSVDDVRWLKKAKEQTQRVLDPAHYVTLEPSADLPIPTGK